MPLNRDWLSLVWFLFLAGVSWADTEVVEKEKKIPPVEKTVCELIDEAAAEHKLPTVFFTRLIWKESSFRPNVVSPKGAQGIAQFMPATAARRGLVDPFDPTEAIPASANYLKDLTAQFGNLGLAAAAYNAGEGRVSDWLAGSRRLPLETRAYVLFITGRSAGDWKDVAVDSEEFEDTEAAVAVNGGSSKRNKSGCAEIAALLSKPGAGSIRIVKRRSGGATWAPWGVQVAGNFSQSRALASYETLQRRHASLLAEHEPLIVSAVVRSRGTAPFHQVRLPFQTRADADRLCARLRKAGGACAVLKNKQ